MKKTQWIDIWHTILRTKVSFISIMLFILMSILFYFGFSWTSDMVNQTVDCNFKESNTRDLEIICSTHLSDDNLDTIRSMPEVKNVEGTRTVFSNFVFQNSNLIGHVREITNDVDKIRIVEGRLPDAGDELVVDIGWANRNDITLDTEITFEKTNDTNGTVLDDLSHDSYTITGFIANPAYSCIPSGTYGYDPISGENVDVIFYGTKDAFVQSDEGYQVLLLTGTELQNYSFDSKEYEDRCSEFNKTVLSKVEEIDRENYKQMSQQYESYGVTLPNYTGCTSQTKLSLKILISVNLLTDILVKLSYCLPTVFLIVGFLITYSAITRLIHSQQTIIGMKKSFGLSTGKIMSGYILYTAFASVLGIAMGVILGYFVEWILCTKVIMRIYYYNQKAMYINVSMIILACFIILLIVSAITFFAVQTIVKKDTTQLMSQISVSNNRQHFYEKWRLWNRLSLQKRMVVNNCVTDHRRVFGTIVGVGVCMALLVGAITFYYNINHSTYVQFDQYFHFHTMLKIDENEPNAMEKAANKLAEEEIETLPIHYEEATMETKENTYGSTKIFVLPKSENKKHFFTLDNFPKESSQNLYDGNSVGHAFKSYYGNDAEDLELIRTNGSKYSIPVDGYFYSYIFTLPIIFTQETYADTFGESPTENVLLVKFDGRSDEEIAKIVKDIDGVKSIDNFYKKEVENFSTFTIVVAVVFLLYIIVAIVTAFLVLLNILYQLVTEKKNELIIMQINGYSEKYARRYVFADNVLLTIIGIIPGAVVGTIIGYYVICSFDSPFVTMLKTPFWLAFVIGAIGTILLSSLMCLISIIRIHRFDITDINK